MVINLNIYMHTYFPTSHALYVCMCIRRHMYIYRVFHFHTDKLSGSVGRAQTIQIQVTMQNQKCRSCELRNEDKGQKSNHIYAA